MHDDDNNSVGPLTDEDQQRALRDGFEKFVDFTAREMIELVMKSDPFLRAYERAGEALNQSVNIDSVVYVICHRLLMSGQTLGERVMANIADRLTIAPMYRI